MTIWRRKRYAFSVITLLTCVFAGVGAAITILGTSVLRPLPFERPNELFHTFAVYDGLGDLWTLDDLERVAEFTRGTTTYAALTSGDDREIAYRGDTATARVVATTPNFFKLLGIPAGTSAYGSLPEAAIISRRLASRLGLASGREVGSAIRVGDKSLTVAAVMDRNKAYPLDVDVWHVDAAPGRNWLAVFRAPNVTWEQFSNRVSLAFQNVSSATGYKRVTGGPMADRARPAMAGSQRMLIAGIAMFSIIAILNYGLLGIGDARRRAQEFAIRVAVGGTRAQVMRALFAGQLMLVGIALLLALSLLIPVSLRVYGASELRAVMLHLPPSLWAALGLTLALLALAAILPTRISASTPEIDVLRRVSARSTPFETWWNRAFVSLQFGVTAFLLVVGTHAIVAVGRDKNTKYGFETSDATVGNVSLSRGHRGQQQVFLTAREYAAQLGRAFPKTATLWATTMRSMSGGKYRFAFDASDARRSIFGIPWLSQDVSPNYFDVVGVRIVEGRAFREADDAQAAPVIILSERAAKKLWGTTNVLGRRIRFGENDGQWRTVVGVAADTYPIDRLAFRFHAHGALFATGFAYRPLAQTYPEAADVDREAMENGIFVGGRSGFSVLVRDGNVESISKTLHALLERVAPGEKFRDIIPLDRYLDFTGDTDRSVSTMRLLVAFTACGLLLGIIGTMVLVDDVVRGRTREFGVRRALGAQSGNLIALAGRETIFAGITGVGVGVALGIRFGPFVSMWLGGNRGLPPTPIDWTLVSSGIATLLIVLVLGTVARAFRAAQLNPVDALRAE